MTPAIVAITPWYPWVHLVTYQFTWFAAVMGGAAAMTWPGVLAASLSLALHLAVVPDPGRASARLCAAIIIGLMVDVSLATAGLVRFTGCEGVIPPLWMVVLWPSFAALFDDLCRWVVKNMWVALVLGACGGPLAYLAGVSFGALAFPQGNVLALTAVSGAWAMATVLLVLVWRWPGVRP